MGKENFTTRSKNYYSKCNKKSNNSFKESASFATYDHLIRNSFEFKSTILPTKNVTYIGLVVFLLMLGAIRFSIYSTFYFLVVLNLILIMTLLFKSYLTIKYAIDCLKKDKNKQFIIHNFPIYSVLLPIYKESKIVKSLINGIEKINYPKDKLQVLVILEEDDFETIKALKNINIPENFHIIYVPLSYPRTKGKACNYALQYVKGDYTVIYDAEDIPHPNQIKEALQEFLISDNHIGCIQAKLNFFNIYENFLSKMMSLEYYMQYDYIFPAMVKKIFPVPLGGSSNHFKTSVLRKLKGWDAYNVTEDAEIGYRLAKEGYKIGMINSYTIEESPIRLKPWLIQRSRWIKGHIITYFTHFKSCFCKKDNVSNKKFFISLQYSMGISPLLQLFIPIAFIITFCYMMDFVQLAGLQSKIVYIVSSISLVLWLKYNIISILLIYKQKKLKEFYIFFLFPVYVLLHSVAAYYALYQLLVNPYSWNKTSHGVSKYKL